MSEHPNAALVRSVYEAVGRGDLETFAAALHDDIVWHESTPGFEGDSRGPDETLALLGRVFETTGLELNGISIDHILADDSYVAVLLETTVTLGDRRQSCQYVDVYRLRDRRLSEHWHLPIDHRVEAELFAGLTPQRR